jgi:hypothetical protein
MTITLPPLDFLLLVFATWRLSYMVVREDWPGNVFRRVRDRFPATGRGGMGDALACIYCTSVWVGAALFVLWLTPVWWLIIPPAVSGMAIMLSLYTGAGASY